MAVVNHGHPEGEPVVMKLYEFSQLYREQDLLLKKQIKQKLEQEDIEIPVRLAKPNRKNGSRKKNRHEE